MRIPLDFLISQFDELKKQRVERENSMNDDEIFEGILGPEKNGYLRAYGPGKSITEYFGAKPTKVELIKQVEAARKEANERVEEAKKEANERVDEMKKQMDEKIEEMNKQWEEKFKMLLMAQNQQTSQSTPIQDESS